MEFNQRSGPPSRVQHSSPLIVLQFHNYVTRLSPHLLNYPSFTPKSDSPTEPTDLDIALRALITNLKPFNLTKAEVLTIINLGVGLDASVPGEGQTGGEEGEDTVMQDGNAANGEPIDSEEQATEDAGEAEDADYGALALLDTVIEDREERLSNEDVGEILRIVRETLGKK